MFTLSEGYERFMGRWSRVLAPQYIAFAGVRNGERVVDVGTGTGSVAAALAAALPSSEIVGIDRSDVDLERLEAERRTEAKRRSLDGSA